MLGHRLRRWPNIKPTLAQHLVLAGKSEWCGCLSKDIRQTDIEDKMDIQLKSELLSLNGFTCSAVHSHKAVSAYFEVSRYCLLTLYSYHSDACDACTQTYYTLAKLVIIKE